MIYCHLYTKMSWLQKCGHLLIMANKNFDFFWLFFIPVHIVFRTYHNITLVD